MFKKILKAINEKRFLKSAVNYLKPYVVGVLISISSITFSKKKIKIYYSKNLKEESGLEDHLVQRIMNSYKKMSEDFNNCKEIYKPSTMWANHLKKDFKFVRDAADNNDFKKFKLFLNNFGVWDEYLGIEHNLLMRRLSKNFFSKKFLEVMIFGRLLKFWEIFNKEKNYSLLNQPKYGNQVGANIENNFVTIGSFFNQIISENLLNHVRELERPIISELGGGYGKLAFYLLNRVKNFCYINFDLPEVLILASYFLIKSFPEKKFLLYGEDEFNQDALKKYDLIFLPSFEFEKIKDNSIDLFINKNSLGEMRKEQVNYFCNRISLSSNYFFHMNHNTKRVIFSKATNEHGLLANEYPLKSKMKLIYKYVDLGHLFQEGYLNYDNDIVMYLYKKI